MKDEIMDIMPSLMEHKRLVIQIVVLTVLIFLVSMLTSHLFISYKEKTDKQQQIAIMQSFINEWKDKNEQLNKNTMRPVEAKVLDTVQTDIIFGLQANKVNITSIKDEKGDKSANGRSYTADFNGQYPDVMRSLQHFQSKDALVSLRHVKMEMKNGLVSSQVTYKIYTRQENKKAEEGKK